MFWEVGGRECIGFYRSDRLSVVFVARSLSGLEKVMILDEKRTPKSTKITPKAGPKSSCFSMSFFGRFVIDFWCILASKKCSKSSQICKKWSWGSSGTRLGLELPFCIDF